MNSTISVVIPAFNEEDNLPVLCKKLIKILDLIEYKYELIIVDDGSTDKTWRVIEKLHDHNTLIRGLRLTRNFGHQRALLAGLLSAKGNAAISLDADLQHPPEVIPQLLEKWNNGYMVVNTIRQSTEKESVLKKVCSKCFYRLFAMLTGSSIKPGMADFRLVDQKVLSVLKSISDPHVFLRGLIPWLGFKSADVSFVAKARQKGKSKYSWRSMVAFAVVGITSFSVFPLRLSILLGLVTSLLAFCELSYVVYVAVFYESVIPGWASTLGIISLLFGILFILLGMIGEYVGQIFESIKGRPIFIVEREI